MVEIGHTFRAGWDACEKAFQKDGVPYSIPEQALHDAWHAYCGTPTPAPHPLEPDVIHFLNPHDFPAVKEFSTVPMLLWCPTTGCGERHIDTGEFSEKPHHTHACQRCGHVWRPAKLNTHGVQFLPGYKN